MTGNFIVFEGIDGCGKTTQINHLSRWLPKSGLMPKNAKLLVTREPGGTEIGKSLRLKSSIFLKFIGNGENFSAFETLLRRISMTLKIIFLILFLFFPSGSINASFWIFFYLT